MLLVTASPLGKEVAELEPMAHENAVDGVSLSVVSLEPTPDLEPIDRLVLAGQGNRRVLGSPAEASSLVDRELHAASRAVARAVRLRIRLGPDVRLVDVLGSYRLDAPEARQVREAERSIDRRLARNLGIRADRGEDEDGIQIVIPSFHANDTHVVLLDVVAERPGPVADVTARYKDVVYSRNGVARARFSLARGTQPPGALELSVLKNVLAHELSRAVRDASGQLSRDNPSRAAALLAAISQLLQGLRLEVPGWSTDEELLNDEAMLAKYLRLLRSRAAYAEHRQSLADSLRYAAFRRLQVSPINE